METTTAVIDKKADVRDFLYDVQGKKNLNISNTVLRERKNVLDLKIVVMIDVSGSISQEEFKKFMLQIDKIRGLSIVRVLEFDTKVVAMYDYFKVPQNEVMRLQGGGGTFFIPVFEQAKKMNPDAILIMTDMDNFDDKDLQNPNIPTASIISSDKESLQQRIEKFPWMKNIGSIVPAIEKNEPSAEQILLEKDVKNDTNELADLEREQDETDEIEDDDDEK